jgi:hypothetical protein
MARLFTFGCSYTATEFYPTWADFLGLEFEYFENWGVTGIGCRGIAERVAECHSKHHFTKDDVIIVQWTTHLRHDYYNPDCAKRPNAIGWKTSGNMFYPANRDVFTDEWIKIFFHESGYIMHCLNAMVLTQELLKSNGCTWYMTSIGDWFKLSSDVFPDNEPIDIRDAIPQFSNYYKAIWEDHKEFWIEPIATYTNRFPELDWYFNDAKSPGKLYREMHPSPKQYVSWLNKFLRPKLQLSNVPKDQTLWIEQLEAIKKDGNNYCLFLKDAYTVPKYRNQYGSKFWPPEQVWPVGGRPYHGY